MAAQRIYHILLASTALGVTGLGLTVPSFAGPEDGTVTAGAATISQTGLNTSIYQSSDRAIIDWRTFDLNSNESVRFFQPGSSSFTLNRINDSKASIINGSIEANGHILLLNQNGIILGSTSRIDVAGLIATTSRINDSAFMSGATTLDFTAGNNPNARIINNGTISARDAGLVGLVGPNVENNGIINAHLGKVTLAGAERFTLDLAGDQLISIDVSDMINGSVKNTGAITADGGTITMTAARARDAVENSIINTGRLQANRVGTRNGRIILSAGGNRAGGTGRGQSTTAAIKQAGKIQASHGSVEILGDSIHLTETSDIDTSSANGGGTINIGGSYQGGTDRPTSTWVQVDAGSSTRSNGGIDGNGGSIIFWADRLMSFRGDVEAEGGDESGDGGLVEVSGKNQLIYDGHVSTLAAHGKTGMLLLDPTNIEITALANQNVTGASPYTPNADDVVSYLNASTLMSALASSSVIVQTRATGSQLGDITVSAALTWSSGNTLTLDAHHDIIINQTIAAGTGGLTLSAGNDVAINAGISGSGTLRILPQSSSGTIGIGTGASGTLQLSNTDLGNITDGWSLIQIGRTDGAGAITLNARTWTDNLEIDTASGAITVNGAQTMGANNLTIRTDADLVLNAALTGTGNLTIEQATAAGTIGLGTAQAGTLNLTTAEVANITNGWNNISFGRADGTGAINVGALTWNDFLTLQSASGIININGTQTMAANNLTIVTDANLNIGGALTGTGTLAIRGQNAATGIGLGTGQTGALQLTNAEVANITNGWGNLIFGRTDGAGDINVGALTWNDFLTLQTGSAATNINGTQTLGANNLTFVSNGNPLINGALTGTGNLSFQTVSPGTTIGLAGEAGTFNLTEAELLNITDGWSLITIGAATGTGAIGLGAHTWNDALLLQSGTGVLTVTGAQTMGANTLTLSTNSDVVLNAALTGTGTLNLQGSSPSTTMGLAGQAGTFNLDATELGRITDGWSSIILGRTDGTGAIAIGATTWNDPLTVQSNTGVITVAGAQAMGANALTFSTNADLVLNGALTGTGTLTIQGAAAGTTMGLGGQAGTLNLDATELGRITDGWSNIILGRTDGTGAIGIGATTWNDNLTIQSNTGIVTIAGAQTMGANTLTLSTGADIALNAALTGSGILNIRGIAAGTTMGLAGQAGSLNLDATELARITDGWSNINLGRTDGTGAIAIGATTWNDTLTIQSNTGVITVAGVQTMGANALTINTDADLVLNAALTGSGILTIQGNTANTTIGLAGQAGTLSLTAVELGRLTDGWSNIILGRTDGTGAIGLGATTWNDALTIQSGTGIITVAGTQTMGANTLIIRTDADLAINAGLTGTGNLTIEQASNGTTMGLGTGQAGTVQLTNAEVANITNGWSNLTFGRSTGTGLINIGALTWNDNLTVQSTTGIISVNGIQTMGANNLTFITDANLAVGAALNGTGTLNIRGQSASTTMGIGTGQAGTIQLTDTEAGNLDNTWTTIIFGRADGTGDINVGALTWVDPVTYQTSSGAVNINGAQAMGANNLTFITDANPLINGALGGTGTLTFQTATNATTIGLAGAAGTFNLSEAELLNITDGWGQIVIGTTTGTGAITANAHTWNDALLLQSNTGAITIAGVQTMGANALTISTDTDVVINAGLTGTGNLTIQGNNAATTIGVAGGAGTLDLGTADIANITDGWSNITIGSATGTGAINLNAAAWNDALTVQSNTGVITVAGAQTMGANNLSLSTNTDLVLNAALTGSGTLTIQGSTPATTIGLAGQAGTLNLDATELSRLTDGWSSIVIGRTDGTGAIGMGAKAWTDNLTVQSSTGVITVAGAQTMAANNLLIRTDADLVVNAGLSGTGNLTIQGNTAGTTMGLGGQAGTLNLGTAEIALLTNTWSNIYIGRTDGTGAINVGALTWADPLTFQSATGVITVAGAQTMGANNLTLTTDADIVLSAALTGTGALTINQNSVGTTMGFGAAAAGTVNLDATEVGRITDGWASINLGRTDGTGAVTLTGNTWNDVLNLRSGSGVLNITGTQTMSATNALNITTDGDINLTGALTGSGTLTISQSSVGTTMGLGAAATGTVNLTAAEIGRITNGWGSLVFGRVDGTGGMNVTANTWNDHLTLRSDTGVISITGTQTMTTNNLTITTNSDLNVGGTLSSTGTGTLTITGQSAATTMGIGTGQAGTIQFTNAEVTNLTNNWANVILGRIDGTGDMNIGASTWVDPLTLRTLTGAINIVGAQAMGANNLTITTDGNLNVGGALTGTATLTITPQSVGTTIGLGTGQAGTMQLSDSEVANLTNTWTNVIIGLTTGTGAMNVGTSTWLDPLTLRTAAGQISINGTQTMGANNLTITTDGNLEVLGTLDGTGALSISAQTATTSYGIGTGQTGTIQFTDAEVANMTNNWTSIAIGSTAGTGVMNVGALSWLDPLTLRTGSGLMTFNGTQTMAANNLTISTDSGIVLNPGANLTGSGNLVITTSAVATTIGLGNSQTGTLNLNTTELGQITDGWNSITIGNAGGTGAMNVGALTFNDALTLRTTTGAMNFNGALTMAAGNNLALNTTSGVIGVNAALNMAGGGNLTVTTDGNMNIAAAGSLTGTGNLQIQTASVGTTIGLGNGAAGTLQLTDVELGRITDGWANHTYGQTGGTGVMTVGANTWTDNVTLQTAAGAINITGAINVGANNLTIRTDGNPTFSNTLAGSGVLTIMAQNAATVVNVAGAATGLAIENSDLGNILNGWSGIILGRSDGSGAMNIGAYAWQYDTTFRTGAGLMTISGAQTSTGNSMTYETDSNIAINAAITGSGTLTIRTSANGTTMGLAGGGGTLQVDATELGRITDGWNQLIFGRSTGTGAFTANARTWTDNVQFISGSGAMSVGAQTMGTNNLTLTTDSNLTLSAASVGGGGKLIIEGASATTAIGVGTGQAGTLVLDATDLSRITGTWSGIQIGNSASTAAMNIGTNSWTQPMTFMTQGNITLNGVQTSSRTSGNSLVFASLGGNFVNATGSATPINPGTGTARYLIYSFSAATDTYGTMTPPGATGNQTYFSYGPGSVVETGNRIIYSQGAPKVVYIQIDNKTKVYGDTVPALTWTYVGGLQGSDTIGMAITNSSLSATGSLVTDNAGTTRNITGSFTAGSGYTVSFVDGTLTVIKAPVTVRGDNATREYGDANPALTVSYVGLRNGDTAADIDVGGVAATTATMTSNVNTYAITTSGASDNNYVFNYANGTLTITKATLTITADDKTREYGDANPALTVSYSGFKNSETSAVIDTNPTLATTAIATTNVGNVAITLTGGTDNNYNLVLVNGNLSITKAMLTATADDKSRAYGDANPALTTTYTGFKNGETAATIGVISTAATAVTAATALSNVGTYAITTSGAVATNYDFTYVNGTLTINKATLTITADDKTRIYGDANPALTVSYSGFKNGENSGVLDSLATAATTAIATTNVGNIAITASGATDTNYDFTYVAGTLAITKATLTATADNKTREYGDANPGFTITYAGFKNGENSGVIDVLASGSTAAIATTNVGSYAITAAGASDGNYDFTYVDGSLAITQATLTATADDKTRLYGDANPTLTTTYTGFKNGETASVIDTAATATTTATALTNVGTATITTSGAADINYTFNYVNGTLTINKATLTITADDKTKVYGDANPALTVSYSGFKNGETSAVLDSLATASTTATALSNVGNVAITAAGAADTNYDFTYVSGNLAITKATITVTVDNKTKVYGDANPALTYVYSGFKNGETSAVIDTGATAVTGATVLSNVGNYAITASGAADTNYDFSYVAGNLSITKADLTITADNKNRIYGDANPALTVSYSGFKNGDTSAVLDTAPTLATTAIATTSVGNVAITLTGGTDNNYNLILNNGTLTINKATLTATADDKTRLYGDTNPAFTVSYTGFKNGETSSVIDTAATASSTANALSNVGTHSIAVSGASDNNYDFVYTSGFLTINKATITVTADNKTRIYGDSNPALTVSYSGFKNGETSAVIDTGATAATAANNLSNVGSYAITASGAADTNYDFIYTAGSLTINKATLTATADNKTREYGDANPALTVSYTGFKNGENSGVIDTVAAAATTAIATTNVGNVAITVAGASDTNYDFTYVNGTLAITKAMLTATAYDKSRIYGDANPALTTTYTGFKNGETASVIDTAATATTAANVLTDVGAYGISTAGALDGNYDFTYVGGTLTINKATLTATADDKTRVYGDANPALTVSYTGFKNGQNASVIDTGATASTTAIGTTNVGNVAITASGASDNNYDFVYVNGNLAITKATITVTADNKTREYGDANPALTVSYTGFKNGETSAVLDTGATATTTAINTTNVGNVAITASGAADTNYDFTYMNGTLAITKAMLTATADDKTKIYGDANPALTVSYTGFKNGENSSVINTGATANTTATALTNVGTASITVSGASDNNYDFTYAAGTLTISKATLTATADNKSREYGDANPALTVSYTGFKNGENAGVIDSGATASTAAINTTDVGSYIISASGASDTNYDFVYADGSLTINKATLTATADNKTREYGDANPALTVSYTGFKNGETSAVIDTGATAATTAINTTNVGNVAITASGASDNNYNFIYVNGTLAITKAMLTATADDKSKGYGAANPALTVSYTGFKNGETSSVINTAATASTAATTGSAVGTYAITASGASDNNYDFTYVAGTLTIGKAIITVTADNKTREYGDANPAFTVSYSGFLNGDTSAVIDTAATATTGATNLSNAGTYAITASGAIDDNYDFVYTVGTLTISKATLNVTADSASREYGDANPAFGVVYTGFKNGENAGVIDTGATATTGATILSNVGTYGVTASGAIDNNYNFTYTAGVLTITKATLSVTADNKTREYGLANPTLTASYSGFKNGDTTAVLNTGVTLATTAVIGSDVGNYGITASGAADNNYDFVYTAGTMAITQASLTITADNKTRDYGDANPALTLSYSGFRNGDTVSSLDTQANASTGATVTSDAGTYTITAAGGSDTNYAYIYVNGTLTVDKADLIVTADNKNKVYGDANPGLTISYSGFKNGETDAVLNGIPAISTLADNLSDAGSYAISLTGGTDNNYNLILNNGTLTVSKAVLTATVDNQTRVYGDANPALTYSYSGFKNGDTSAVLNTGVTVGTTANALSNVGSYAITATGGSDNNYTFAYVNGSLAITQASLTVTVNNATREYGLNNPAFSATYSGFKNGQNASVLDVAPTFSTTATAGSNIGTYTVTASGGSDDNYSMSFVSGNLLITQAALAVYADDQVRLYGDPNPPLTYTIYGLRNGDTDAVLSGLAINTTANALSPIGTYAITVGGASATNYTLSYVNGSLSVVDQILPPAPPPQPIGPLPETAENSMNNPDRTTTYYDRFYNAPANYIFVNNVSEPGHERESGTIRTQDGYITIFYYENPFAKTYGEPLLFIDQNLYIYEDNKEESLASFILN